MLIKAATPQARMATFAAAPTVSDSRTDATAEHVDPRDAQIADLRDRIVELEGELADHRREWSEALARGVDEVKAAAAREHVEDDQSRFDAVVEALRRARAEFETRLEGECAALARSIALHGFERLAAAAAEEKDWLGRLVARRLAEIAPASLIAARLPAADYSQAQSDRLRELLPPGTRVDFDGDLPSGQARIALRLGEVAIDGEAGAARVAALIAGHADA